MEFYHGQRGHFEVILSEIDKKINVYASFSLYITSFNHMYLYNVNVLNCKHIIGVCCFSV